MFAARQSSNAALLMFAMLLPPTLHSLLISSRDFPSERARITATLFSLVNRSSFPISFSSFPQR